MSYVRVKDVLNKIEQTEEIYFKIKAERRINELNEIELKNYMKMFRLMKKLYDIRYDITHRKVGLIGDTFFCQRTIGKVAMPYVDKYNKQIRKAFSGVSIQYRRKEKLKKIMNHEKNIS